MITQIRTNIKSLRKQILYYSAIFNQSTSSGTVKNNVISNKEYNENQLKLWKEVMTTTKKSLVPESKGFLLFELIQNKIELNPWSISKFIKSRALKTLQSLQEVNHVLEETVGFEIAAAYFLVFQGGKVKFKGHDKWIALNKDLISVNLPRNYDSSYVITEIDASDTEIYYEGLLNFRNAQRVKRAIFKRCSIFDDWHMDRISSYFPYLEYLDISDCPKVSERGLEALYKCSDLKTVIVTNYSKKAAFELTCLMLEDCIPGLQVEILKPKETTKLDTNQINM